MAALFYSPVTTGSTIFRNGLQVNTSMHLPFLNNLLGGIGWLVVTEVTIQNRDTIQYFLTFDDLISYFYFGKGLGSITINGILFSDCDGYFRGANSFTSLMSNIRGTTQNVSFGNAVFKGVVSSFTVRASAEEGNCVEFNLQMDVIDHSLAPPRFTASC